VAGFCEHCSGTLGSMKCGELDELRNCWRRTVLHGARGLYIVLHLNVFGLCGRV